MLEEAVHNFLSVVWTDSTEPLNKLTTDVKQKESGADKIKEQAAVINDERVVSSSMHDSSSMGASKDVTWQSHSSYSGRDYNSVYRPNMYPSPAQSVYYGGYQTATGEWDDCPRYVNSNSVELASPGLYGENSSLIFHSGYGYNPHLPYGPYSPVTTPVPSLRGDHHLYSAQQFPLSGSYYHQPVPASMPYLSSPLPVSQSEHPMPVGPDRQGFDGFGPGGPMSEWSKLSDRHSYSTSWPSPIASPQPIATFGSLSHNASPLAAGVRPTYGYASMASPYDRSYSPVGMYHGVNFNGSVSGLNVGSQSWIAVDKGRRRGRGSAPVFSCNGNLDVLDEQTKGPRASILKSRTLGCSSSVDAKTSESGAISKNELYNHPDFFTDYKQAKFFIIKSYSEDNIHKSIKYGVWASTANGNRRLDAAFREAEEKDPSHPVFLFFSVNASGQFLGVAQMTGPVDFDKSVNYWQQDKWSGHFPVKWHILKDVPNSQFRHIILENNDNKPVTNSRDTQEVKLEKGLEILNIFKTYETDLSILDDFEYYENRQKIMQERKAKQDGSLMSEPRSEASQDFIKHMSESFGRVVRLEENDQSSGRREVPASEA